MSEKTQKMAEEMYERMCEYVGPNHKQECIPFIKFSLDSMEVQIISLQAQLKERDELIKELVEAVLDG